MAKSEQPALADRVHGNIESIAQLQAEAERTTSNRQLLIERIAAFVGRPWTVIVLICGAAVWITLNEYLAHTGRAPIDEPPFFWLQGTLSLFAALVTTMVLVAQTRQRREAERRAHLELHVNLLAEQKATKIIGLLEELRRDMPQVHDRVDPEAEAFQEEIDPKAVDDALRTEPHKR